MDDARRAACTPTGPAPRIARSYVAESRREWIAVDDGNDVGLGGILLFLVGICIVVVVVVVVVVQ